VRFSLILPAPGDASPGQVLDFAVAAEQMGYEAVYMNSRVARPVEVESRHPYTPDGSLPWPPDVKWPDAFVLFSFVAARTTRLRFGPAVVPVIVTHPLTLAKQAATLDLYSGGRLELGLGAGWMLEEAHAVARLSDQRWRRLEETIEILKLSWSRPTFAYEGRCYRIPEVGQLPHPAQPGGPPLWIGGRGQRALEIAARFGAGVFLWGGLEPEAVSGYVRRIRELGGKGPVAVLFSLIAHGDEVEKAVAEMEAAGADELVMSGRFPAYEQRLAAAERIASRLLPVRGG
jgi:probable F420-dependent oxidoreductase